MEEKLNRMKELKISREKNVKKLTKLLKLLVNAEWEILAEASSNNDNISKLATKSISEASSSIQTAITQLISTNINIDFKEENSKKNDKTLSTIRSLKKVLINKK